MGEMVRINSYDPDRPLFVTADGWRVSVATMDGYHLRRRAEWIRQLAQSHPDHPDKKGSCKRFIETGGSYRRWMNEEKVRYGRLGLVPPRRA